MRRITATLEDVAAQAGVSKTTAAAILRNASGFRASEETRKRVLEASARLGYHRNAVATSLSLGRTHTVGLLLPRHHMDAATALARVYGQDVFLALYRAATRAGLHVTPVPPPQSGDHFPLQAVADRRMDGLIAASLNDAAFIEAVEEAQIPCVEVGSGTGRYLVHPDNEGGAEAAVAHLAALGHRRIAHWYGYADSHASEHRCSGFVAAVARYGIADAPIVYSHEEMRTLLRRPATNRPTAIFTFHDAQALELLDMAREAGLRVPTDLSVVGFDDNVLAEAARPALTTIHNSLNEQGDVAIRTLQALWRGDLPATDCLIVPTRLVIRDSTAPPPPGH